MDSFVLSVCGKAQGQDTFGSRIGPVSYLQVPDSDTKPLPSHDMGTVKQWLDNIVNQANPPGTAAGKELDIVFFVHG